VSGCHFVFLALGICVDFWFRLKKCVDLRRSISFVGLYQSWQGFFNDNSKRTLPIAIAGFFGQHQFTQWGYVFAMSVLTLIPVVVIFILCQKFFVQGLTAGGVKG
jgi:multiple sugar transport system permease protein